MEILPKQFLIPIYSHGKQLELLSMAAKDWHNIGFETVILDNIMPGHYQLSTETFDESEVSLSVEFTVTGDSKRSFVEKAMTIIGQNKKSPDNIFILNNIIEKADMIKTLFELYLKNEDEEKLAAALALQSVLDLINKAICQAANSNDYIMDFHKNILLLDYRAKKLIDIEYRKDQRNVTTVHRIEEGKDFLPVHISENSLHFYLITDENEDFIQLQIGFRPNAEIVSKFWKKSIEEIDKYKTTIEKKINYPNSYMDFTDEEQEWLSIIDSLMPVQPIINCPSVFWNHGEISVALEDIELLQALNKKFYISFREPELALNKHDQRRVEINNSFITFYAAEYFISRERYLLWVEDEDGNIISMIQMLDFEHNSEGTEFNGKDTAFNEKIRQLQMYNYGQHLMPYLSNKYDDIRPKIEEAFLALESDETTYPVSFVREAMGRLCIRQNISDIPRIIQAIKEDNTIYGNYLIEYLDHPIRFRYKENTVDLPPKANCLYIIDMYTVGMTPNRILIQAAINTSKSYRFYDTEYAIVYCLDMQTYKTSGFIAIDFSQHTIEPHIYKYLIDEIEVVYK